MKKKTIKQGRKSLINVAKILLLGALVINQSCQKNDDLIDDNLNTKNYSSINNTLVKSDVTPFLMKNYITNVEPNLKIQKKKSAFGNDFRIESISDEIKNKTIYGIEVFENLDLPSNYKASSFLLHFGRQKSTVGFLVRFIESEEETYTEVVSVLSGQKIASNLNVLNNKYFTGLKLNKEVFTKSSKSTCNIGITECKKYRGSSAPYPDFGEPINCITGQLLGLSEAADCNSINLTGGGSSGELSHIDIETVEPDEINELTCNDLVRAVTTNGEIILLEKEDIAWVSNTDNAIANGVRLDPRMTGYKYYYPDPNAVFNSNDCSVVAAGFMPPEFIVRTSVHSL